MNTLFRESFDTDLSAITDAGRERLATLVGQSHTLQMTPHRTGTDGFFIALFERLP